MTRITFTLGPMKIAFKFIVLLFFFGIVGCGPNFAIVQGTKTVHHQLNSINGNIYLANFTEKEGEDLLFKKYADTLENYLFGYGFRVVDDIQEADYVAFISYGIGPPIVNTYSVPVYSYTPGKTKHDVLPLFSPRYGHLGFVSTTTYTMPKYELVGTEVKSYITYQRNFAMDILSVDSVFKKEQTKKVYEGRIKSIGACNTVDAVMTELIQIMFDDFPGSQGTNNVEVLSLTAANNC